MVHPVLPGYAGHRQTGEDLLPHLHRLLGSEHRRAADPLPLGPGPLLALDASVPDVAPLPLGDGQSEVQQELAGGGGGVELPLGEDHQVDAGVGHVPDETEAVHGPAADAVDGGDHQGVAGLQPGPEVLERLAVAPGARADLGDDLVDAVVLELLGLGLQVALVLGGLADPGEADDEGKAVDGGPLRLLYSESWGKLMSRKPFCQGFPQGGGVAAVGPGEGRSVGDGEGSGKRPFSAGEVQCLAHEKGPETSCCRANIGNGSKRPLGTFRDCRDKVDRTDMFQDNGRHTRLFRTGNVQ